MSLTLTYRRQPSARSGFPITAGPRFYLPVDTVDPKAHYSVEAHLHLTGNGQVTPGGYLSLQSYPVLTYGHGDTVEIELLSVQ